MHGIIPIYLNLKEFRPEGAIDSSAVLAFVKASINRANDRYVEKFLEDEFDHGVEEGTWLFLFDSFDEIPAILGTVEADELIEEYSRALFEFLHGMNQCRGIIATREFRGPKRITWPKFRVLRLSEKQRRELIERLDLPQHVETRLLVNLESADSAIRQLADNPLFLALLCEHQRDAEEFPHNSHVVFENYVSKRFLDDRERLLKRFGKPPEFIRMVAESAAYCMAKKQGLGLSPSRQELLEAIEAEGLSEGSEAWVALDALEYLRLARGTASPEGTKGFTFAHRRFQEYFATCLVMQQDDRQEPFSLLLDGRWRETAVTLLQNQQETQILPILSEADRILDSMGSTVVASAAHLKADDAAVDPLNEACSESGDSLEIEFLFQWPQGSLHLVALLQAAFGSADPRLPLSIRRSVGSILAAAFSRGQLHDKRWALENCVAADPATTLDLLQRGFQSDSAWLREAAYAQSSRLSDVPDGLRHETRRVLAGMAAGGRLRRQWLAVSAQVQRLPDPRPERLLQRLFLLTPFVDAILWFLLWYIAQSQSPLSGPAFDGSAATLSVSCLAGHASLYLVRDTRRLEWGGRYAGLLRWYYNFVEVLGASNRHQFFQIGLGVRAYAAFFVWLLGFEGSGDMINWPPSFSLSALAGVLATAFVASWGISAVYADQILNRARLANLIFLPFTALGKGTSRMTNGMAKWEISRSSILGALVSSTVAGLCLLAFWFAIPWIVRAIDGLGAFGWVAYLVLTCGWILFVAVRNAISWWQDHKLTRRVEGGDVAVQDPDELLAVLQSFKSERAVLLLVQDLKRQRSLVGHPGALTALEAFAGDSTVAQSVRDEVAKIVADVELERQSHASSQMDVQSERQSPAQ